jgi:3',5'-cyclic AMP phosphodiesterase CpdA
MRTLAHISDLHFGKEDPPVADALLAELRERAPGLVAVSGDVTQRARAREFRAARAFLDRLPGVVLVVPGNHDVPLWDVVSRFARPLRNYRRHLTPELAPFFIKRTWP